MHKKLVKIVCGSVYILEDRQTDRQTHGQVYSSQYFATAPAGEVTNCVTIHIQNLYINVQVTRKHEENNPLIRSYLQVRINLKYCFSSPHVSDKPRSTGSVTRQMPTSDFTYQNMNLTINLKIPQSPNASQN